MHRFRAMRDTLAFDIAVIAVSAPAAITLLILFTSNRGVL